MRGDDDCVVTLSVRSPAESAQLSRDVAFVGALLEASRDPDRRHRKPAVLQVAGWFGLGLAEALLQGLDSLPHPCRLPTATTHLVAGLLDQWTVFGSFMAPILFRFKPAAQVRCHSCGVVVSSRSPPPQHDVPALIAKSGDDLCADALVHCMASLMNGFFADAQLPLHITTYQGWRGNGADTSLNKSTAAVVPTGDHEGLIEFLPGCSELSDVQQASPRPRLRRSSRLLCAGQHGVSGVAVQRHLAARLVRGAQARRRALGRRRRCAVGVLLVAANAFVLAERFVHSVAARSVCHACCRWRRRLFVCHCLLGSCCSALSACPAACCSST